MDMMGTLKKLQTGVVLAAAVISVVLGSLLLVVLLPLLALQTYYRGSTGLEGAQLALPPHVKLLGECYLAAIPAAIMGAVMTFLTQRTRLLATWCGVVILCLAYATYGRDKTSLGNFLLAFVGIRIVLGTPLLVGLVVWIVFMAYEASYRGSTELGNILLFSLGILLAAIFTTSLENGFLDRFYRVRAAYRRLLWRKGLAAGMRLADDEWFSHIADPSPPERYCPSCAKVLDAGDEPLHRSQGHHVWWVCWP